MRHHIRNEREQLELFRALPGDLAPRDAQDLMAYPFFSLAKTHRTTRIDFRMNEIAICVEAVPEHGMATIRDADVLIWAASQIVEARDAGLRTSRLMVTTPREILTFAHRGTSARDYHRLKAALDRLQSTTVATSLRQTSERHVHRFSWINEWTERADAHGNAERCARSRSSSGVDRQCDAQLMPGSVRPQSMQRNRGSRTVTPPNRVAIW
jgi:plasmid replication initiation protein